MAAFDLARVEAAGNAARVVRAAVEAAAYIAAEATAPIAVVRVADVMGTAARVELQGQLATVAGEAAAVAPGEVVVEPPAVPANVAPNTGSQTGQLSEC